MHVLLGVFYNLKGTLKYRINHVLQLSGKRSKIVLKQTIQKLLKISQQNKYSELQFL